jgi:hypothetical protein
MSGRYTYKSIAKQQIFTLCKQLDWDTACFNINLNNGIPLCSFTNPHVNDADPLFRRSDRSSKRTTLNISTTEIPILSSSPIITRARKTKNTQMPVCTIGRRATGEGTSSLGKRISAGRVPKGDLIRCEVLVQELDEQM